VTHVPSDREAAAIHAPTTIVAWRDGPASWEAFEVSAPKRTRPDPARAGQPAPPADSDEAERPRDVLFVGGKAETGGWQVLRRREDSLEIGEVRPAVEGKPIHGEVVRLSPRKESERLFDVEVLVPRDRPPPEPRNGKGPAQVASDAYRTNWDAIFGARRTESVKPS
jgi:hypothetical protein